MEVDINVIVSSLVSGGAVWLAIKTEIRLLWRDMDMIHKRIEKVES